MDTPEDPASTKRVALLVATLSSFLTPFMGSSINVALPDISNELGMDAVALGWIASAYLLAAAMLLVPFGRLSDIYGRKRIFTYGVAIYSIGSLLAGFVSSGSMLIAARVVQGIGGAMMFGIGIAILTSVFPPHERGQALGINSAAVYIGLASGPFIGGILTEQFGWRTIFFSNAALGVAVLLIVFRGLKGEWAGAKGAKLDVAGSLVYSATLVLVMYGFSLLPSTTGAVLLAAGVVGGLGFVRWEFRASSPVLDMRLFSENRVFALSSLATLINYSASYAVTFLLSLYLQYLKGLSPQEAGLVLVAQPVVMAAGSPFAGKLSDKIEPRIVASAGMGLIAIGLGFFAFLTDETPVSGIVGGLVFLGAGFALFSSPNTNAVMSSVEKRVYGVAAGTLATMRMTGQMLSLGIAMLIFAVLIGRVQIVAEHFPQFLLSVRTAFAVFAGLCVGGIFASLARGRIQRPAGRAKTD